MSTEDAWAINTAIAWFGFVLAIIGWICAIVEKIGIGKSIDSISSKLKDCESRIEGLDKLIQEDFTRIREIENAKAEKNCIPV